MKNETREYINTIREIAYYDRLDKKFKRKKKNKKIKTFVLRFPHDICADFFDTPHR